MYVPTETNHWVDENFARLAEILKDYDPALELRWIPPDKRVDPEDRERPYCIVDTRSNYVIRHCNERDDPVAVLASIFNADNKHGNVLNRIDAQNAATEAFRLKERIEQQEEQMDLAAFFMGTKKNYIQHKGVKFDDQMRRLT
jgi:hypothetical protein